MGNGLVSFVLFIISMLFLLLDTWDTTQEVFDLNMRLRWTSIFSMCKKKDNYVNNANQNVFDV